MQFLEGDHRLANVTVFERTRETRISRGWSTRSLKSCTANNCIWVFCYTLGRQKCVILKQNFIEMNHCTYYCYHHRHCCWLLIYSFVLTCY